MRLNEQQKMLIQKAQEWEVAHGRPPRVNDWKHTSDPDSPSYGYPSWITAHRAFGTWDAFIKTCGWKPRGRGRPRKP